MKWLWEKILPAFATIAALIDINTENSELLKLFQDINFSEPTTLLGIKLVILICLLTFWWRIRRHRKTKIQNWLDCFSYAGSATEFDLKQHLHQNRRVDVKYVELKRGLNKLRPMTMDYDQPSNHLASDDAVEYLHKLRSNHFRSKNQQQTGILLEGGPYIGKTRILCELIKQNSDDSFLLILNPNITIPALTKEIQRYLGQKQIEILLDDMERFEDDTSNISQLLQQLNNTGLQTFLWSTVRNGGPATKVQESESFRQLRERLERFVLDPPNNQAMQDIAKSADEDLPINSKDYEHSFSFVEHQQFEEMLRRWNHELKEQEPAKNIMRCAAALDKRGISLELPRWKKLANSLCDLNINKDWTDAWSQLEQYNFLSKGIPDPGHLKYVVDTTFQDNDNEIMTSLVNSNDAEGVYQWCLNKANEEDYDFLLDNLKPALEWAGENESVLKARMFISLGWVYWKKSKFEQAKSYTELALEQALSDKSSVGWQKAAQVSYNLGFILNEQKQYQAAETAYREVISFAQRAETPDGWVNAAQASISLGILLNEQKQYQAAETAYLEAIAFVQRAETPDGWVQAAQASISLGILLNKQKQYQVAETAYQEAITFAQRAETPDGWVQAAQASSNLGILLKEQKQYEAAETAYREAIAFAQRAETPDGWVQARNASYNLANQFGNNSDYKKAKEYYQQSVRYYFQSGKFVNSIETSFYKGVDCFLKIVPLETDIDKLESKSVTRPLGIVGYTGQYGVNTWGDKLEDDKKQTVMQQLSVVLNTEITHATDYQICTRSLPFCPGIALHELTDINDLNKSFYLYHSGGVLPIQEVKSINFIGNIGMLRLNRNNILDYLRFYTEFTYAEQGSFVLLDDIKDINWNNYQPSCHDELKKLTIELPHLIENHSTDQDGYVVKAVFLYGDCLFQSLLLVQDNGSVEILEETALIENLPLVDNPGKNTKIVPLQQLLVKTKP